MLIPAGAASSGEIASAGLVASPGQVASNLQGDVSAHAADVEAVDHAGEAELVGVVTVRPPETAPRPEPTWDEATVVVHEIIDGHYHRLVLRSPSIASRATAGQFVMITVPSDLGERILLPRPMAIHRRHTGEAGSYEADRYEAVSGTQHNLDGTIEVIFSIVGRGTAALARIEVGAPILLTGPLGRGFEIPQQASSILLMSHGSGACAVMGVAEDAAARGIPTTALLSAAMRSAVVGESDCIELGVESIIVTEDRGTNDIPNVATLLHRRFDAAPPSAVMVCGSSALARAAVALGARWDVPVQVSLEAHMACGLGYCHGCAAPVATDGDREGPLVCQDGPVFDGFVPAAAG